MKNIPNLTSPNALEFFLSCREMYERQRDRHPEMTPTRKPRFYYQNLPDSERLSYELLTWDNFKQMLELFKNDANPYVNKEFKSLKKL